MVARRPLKAFVQVRVLAQEFCFKGYDREEYIMNELFSYAGRLNRLPYLIRTMFLYIVPALIVRYANAWSDQQVNPPLLLAKVLLVGVVIVVIVSWLQAVKRLHDLDMSGWYTLIFLVPVLNVVFQLYLLFKKGSDGSNRYDEEPLVRPANSSQ